MGDYFQPLRRKIGVVTLLVACVFAALWIRGFAISDEFNSTSWTRNSRGISFENGPSFVYHLNRSSGQSERHVVDHNSMRVQIIAETWIMEIFNVPQWSIAIPLTILSAWLLLSRQRLTKPTAISER